MSRSSELKKDFRNIMEKWKQAFESLESELSRDAAILRFVRRLADEVGWKLIQRLAREEGYEVKSPRQAFQQAFSLGWITDEVIWDDIIKPVIRQLMYIVRPMPKRSISSLTAIIKRLTSLNLQLKTFKSGDFIHYKRAWVCESRMAAGRWVNF